MKIKLSDLSVNKFDQIVSVKDIKGGRRSYDSSYDTPSNDSQDSYSCSWWGCSYSRR